MKESIEFTHENANFILRQLSELPIKYLQVVRDIEKYLATLFKEDNNA